MERAGAVADAAVGIVEDSGQPRNPVAYGQAEPPAPRTRALESPQRESHDVDDLLI